LEGFERVDKNKLQQMTKVGFLNTKNGNTGLYYIEELHQRVR
jgi:hypothetical protein